LRGVIVAIQRIGDRISKTVKRSGLLVGRGREREQDPSWEWDHLLSARFPADENTAGVRGVWRASGNGSAAVVAGVTVRGIDVGTD
jgi:hypothetical protein